MTEILAVDPATWCGWCRGTVGEPPTFGSVRFGGPHDRPAAVYATAVDWFGELLAHPPDVLMLEAVLPPSAWRGQSQATTFARLGGLQSIALGLAHKHGVGEITEVSVASIRAHFIGDRGMKRAVAKKAVVARCKRLGWEVSNDNEGDACALWSYGCALIDPKLALRVVPLFNWKLVG
jgi:hypothetical protein